MDGFHVAQGTTSTKQSAKRWAAMRLLQELDHVIAPAFFKDTADGASPLLCLNRITSHPGIS